MNRIWKYKLRPGSTALNLPHGAVVRHVGYQGNDVCLWAEVDPDNADQRRIFFAVPTGGIVPDGATYISSVQFSEDELVLVFHIFEGAAQ